MRILAIGTSNNANSINRHLARAAAALVPQAEVDSLQPADFNLPLYSAEQEAKLGTPALARRFYQRIFAADALVLSFAEHNGSYTAAWKNLFDWTSRIDTRVYQDKPVVLLSTSPGKSGARSVSSAPSLAMP